MSERYLFHVRHIQKPEEYRDIELALRFLKQQLLIRVIKDNGQIRLEPDYDYKYRRDRWYPKQFKDIRAYLGTEIEEQVVEMLRTKEPRDVNSQLYYVYKKLIKESSGKTSWSSIFF